MKKLLLCGSILFIALAGCGINSNKTSDAVPLEYLGKNINDIPSDKLGESKEDSISHVTYVKYYPDNSIEIGGVLVSDIELGYENDNIIDCVRWCSGVGNSSEMGEKLLNGLSDMYGKADNSTAETGFLGYSEYYEWHNIENCPVLSYSANPGIGSYNIYWQSEE